MAADADHDDALLDALYREGRAGDADELAEGERATVAEWRAVRGVVRQAREQGFDVEPPAAGSRGSMELLMAAARAHAPAKAGLWSRLRGWLLPLVAHPAMAGAAALVVVGGAAGVLYLNGKSEVARPPAATQWTGAGSSADSPAPPATVATPGVGAGGGEEREEGAATAVAPAETEAAGRGAGPLVAPTGVEGDVRAPRAPVGARSPAHRDKPAPTKPADGPLRDGEAQVGGATDEKVLEDVAGGLPVSDSLVTESPSVEPPPAPPPPPPPRAECTSTAKPPATRPAQIATDDAEPPASRAQAVTLTAQARTAARAGDCARVGSLSKQVAALDVAYHRDVFVRDPDIARCR